MYRGLYPNGIRFSKGTKVYLIIFYLIFSKVMVRNTHETPKMKGVIPNMKFPTLNTAGGSIIRFVFTILEYIRFI